MKASRFIYHSSENGGIPAPSSNREPPSLFRPPPLVVHPCSLHKSFLERHPPLLLKGKTGGMSGGHFESLSAGNIHEGQNRIVSAQLDDFMRVAEQWVNFHKTTRPYEGLGYRRPITMLWNRVLNPFYYPLLASILSSI